MPPLPDSADGAAAARDPPARAASADGGAVDDAADAAADAAAAAAAAPRCDRLAPPEPRRAAAHRIDVCWVNQHKPNALSTASPGSPVAAARPRAGLPASSRAATAAPPWYARPTARRVGAPTPTPAPATTAAPLATHLAAATAPSAPPAPVATAAADASPAGAQRLKYPLALVRRTRPDVPARAAYEHFEIEHEGHRRLVTVPSGAFLPAGASTGDDAADTTESTTSGEGEGMPASAATTPRAIARGAAVATHRPDHQQLSRSMDAPLSPRANHGGPWTLVLRAQRHVVLYDEQDARLAAYAFHPIDEARRLRAAAAASGAADAAAGAAAGSPDRLNPRFGDVGDDDDGGVGLSGAFRDDGETAFRFAAGGGGELARSLETSGYRLVERGAASSFDAAGPAGRRPLRHPSQPLYCAMCGQLWPRRPHGAAGGSGMGGAYDATAAGAGADGLAMDMDVDVDMAMNFGIGPPRVYGASHPPPAALTGPYTGLPHAAPPGLLTASPTALLEPAPTAVGVRRSDSAHEATRDGFRPVGARAPPGAHYPHYGAAAPTASAGAPAGGRAPSPGPSASPPLPPSASPRTHDMVSRLRSGRVDPLARETELDRPYMSYDYFHLLENMHHRDLIENVYQHEPDLIEGVIHVPSRPSAPSPSPSPPPSPSSLSSAAASASTSMSPLPAASDREGATDGDGDAAATTATATASMGRPVDSMHDLPADLLNAGYYDRFFVEQRRLGRGAGGSVFLCQHMLDGIVLGHFAVKTVPVGESRRWLAKTLGEVHLVQGLRHPNIIAYKHAWLEHRQLTRFGPPVPCLFILMEYANGGNLEEYLELSNTGSITALSQRSHPDGAGTPSSENNYVSAAREAIRNRRDALRRRREAAAAAAAAGSAAGSAPAAASSPPPQDGHGATASPVADDDAPPYADTYTQQQAYLHPAGGIGITPHGKKVRYLGLGAQLRLFLDVARAVAHLHGHGLVHHDIKPGNLLLHFDRPDDPNTLPRVLLGDFGQVEALGPGGGPGGLGMGMGGSPAAAAAGGPHGATSRSGLPAAAASPPPPRTGATGTIDFMPPEAVRLDANGAYLPIAHPRAIDCWSLGVLLFYIAYSRMPWRASDPDEAYARVAARGGGGEGNDRAPLDPIEQLRAEILAFEPHTALPAPTRRVPTWLQDVIAALMRPEPTHRMEAAEVVHLITAQLSAMREHPLGGAHAGVPPPGHGAGGHRGHHRHSHSASQSRSAAPASGSRPSYDDMFIMET